MQKIDAITNRKKLTKVWKENGIENEYEYGILTNEIYKTWSSMKANKYKKYKGIRKELLRDNMTDIEIALTDLGELATRELTKEHKPQGLVENKKIAKIGGEVANNTRKDIESKLGKSVVVKQNSLPYQYKEDKLIDIKK